MLPAAQPPLPAYVLDRLLRMCHVGWMVHRASQLRISAVSHSTTHDLPCASIAQPCRHGMSC